MGFRFRKSVKLGGLRINFSKSGIGYSYGGKGARVTKMANGRTRTTLSVPGTGISYVTETGRRKNKKRASSTGNTTKHGGGRGVFVLLVIILVIICLVAICNKKEDTAQSKYSMREVLYSAEHPRIYDTIESVKKYIDELDVGKDVRLQNGPAYAKASYDGWQSKEDGIVAYREGATYTNLVECVKLIIDDEEVAVGLDANSAVALYNTYLPNNFYDDYELKYSYVKKTDTVETYVASFRLTTDVKERANYFTFYVKHNMETNLWVIENDFDFGGGEISKIENYEVWDFPYFVDDEQ